MVFFRMKRCSPCQVRLGQIQNKGAQNDEHGEHTQDRCSGAATEPAHHLHRIQHNYKGEGDACEYSARDGLTRRGQPAVYESADIDPDRDREEQRDALKDDGRIRHHGAETVFGCHDQHVPFEIQNV
jgi:hypothetical protein